MRYDFRGFIFGGAYTWWGLCSECFFFTLGLHEAGESTFNQPNFLIRPMVEKSNVKLLLQSPFFFAPSLVSKQISFPDYERIPFLQ